MPQPSLPGTIDALRRNLGRARRLLFEPHRAERVRAFFDRRRGAVAQRPSTEDSGPRAANRKLLDRELAEEAPILASQPTNLLLDPATICNLKCPFCPTGAGYTGLAKEVLTPEQFERIVAHLRVDLLEEVCLYNWGEPFLNRHLFDYIRYFADRGIRTEISTNFSVKDYDDAFLDGLVASGLTTLIVSIDGASQESYEKYRVRGSFERVVRNMKRLAEAKRDRGSRHPRVLYKMLLHRFNEHEIEKAREIAGDCSAEFVLNERFWCPDDKREEWLATNTFQDRGEPIPQGYSNDPGQVISTYCRQLWDSAIVNADGAVFPCCLIFQPEYSVGNLVDQDIDEIRNNPAMVGLRRFVVDPSSPAPGFSNYCENCPSRWCTVKSPPGALAAS